MKIFLLFSNIKLKDSILKLIIKPFRFVYFPGIISNLLKLPILFILIPIFFLLFLIKSILFILMDFLLCNLLLFLGAYRKLSKKNNRFVVDNKMVILKKSILADLYWFSPILAYWDFISISFYFFWFCSFYLFYL